MSLINIYTKKMFGLDYGVWIVMLACILLSLGLLGYKLANQKSCTPDLIQVNGVAANDYDLFHTNEQLRVELALLAGENVTWYFGDVGGAVKQGAVVTYQYKDPGNYPVKAVIKGPNYNCEKTVMLKIRNHVQVQKEQISLEISGDTYAVQGESKTYYCNDVANTYRWRLLAEVEDQEQNTPSAKFIFPGPGDYIIELMLNNNPARTATKSVKILDKTVLRDPITENIGPLLNERVTPRVNSNGTREPVTPLLPPKPEPSIAAIPEKSKIIEVLPETFQAELEQVIAFKKQPEELAAKYLAYGISTKVKINRESDIRQFIDFCYSMRNLAKGKRKFTIKSVSFDKDATGITTINLEIVENKSGPFGLLKHEKKNPKL